MGIEITPHTHQPLMPGYLAQAPRSPSSVPEKNFKSQYFEDEPPFQPPAPRSWVTRWTGYVYRTWFMEFIAIFVAFTFLALALGLLAIFNSKLIDETGTGIWSSTPTATLNFLVAVMRTAMLLPVASGIAQLKWDWYRNRHSPADIEVYDDAMVGVAGSLKLLAKRRFWNLAAIGALLTVLSFTLETVVAQSIYMDYNGKPVPYNDSSWSVPRTNRYEWWQYESSGAEIGDQIPIAAVQAAVDYGLSYGFSWEGDQPVREPNCTSGNCDFGPYQTIGVDTICIDISDKIQSNGQDYYIPANAGLDSDLPLPIDGGLINSTTSFLYPDTDWFPRLNDLGPLISNTYIISNWNGSLNQPPFAVECILFWTVITYESETLGGYWNETSLSNWTANYPINQTSFGQVNDITMTPPYCYVNGSSITDYYSEDVLDPIDGMSECIYTVKYMAQYALQYYLANPAYGMNGDYVSGSCSQCFLAKNKFAGYLAQLLLYSISGDPVGDIQVYMFENLAYFLTTTIRQLPRGTMAVQGMNGAYTMPSQGIMYDFDRFRARWGIMTYPTLLIVSCAAFVFTVAMKRRDRVWKKSNLPLLFHGLGQEDRVSVANIEEYAEMKEKANEMYVHFANTAEGLRMVSHHPAGVAI